MTMEERIKMALGDLLFQNIMLIHKIEELNKNMSEKPLKSEAEKKKDST